MASIILKNSGKKKDPEKNRLKKEIERLRDIFLSLGRRDRSSKKKDQLGLLGPSSGYRLSAEVKKKLLAVVQNSFLPAKRACKILGLKPKRFYRWRKEYLLFAIDGLLGNTTLFFKETSAKKVTILVFVFMGNTVKIELFRIKKIFNSTTIPEDMVGFIPPEVYKISYQYFPFGL